METDGGLVRVVGVLLRASKLHGGYECSATLSLFHLFHCVPTTHQTWQYISGMCQNLKEKTFMTK